MNAEIIKARQDLANIVEKKSNNDTKTNSGRGYFLQTILIKLRSVACNKIKLKYIDKNMFGWDLVQERDLKGKV